MTLIVENGFRLANANSYASLVWANEYHDTRGNTAWGDADESERERALIRATDYMGQVYRARWQGWRCTTEQRLDWPRQGVRVPDMPIAFTVDVYTVPVEVRAACAELALRALSNPTLAPDLERAVLAESVGSLSVTYDRGSVQVTRFRVVDNLLAPFLQGGGPMVRIGRV
jgi:hypothetical protein